MAGIIKVAADAKSKSGSNEEAIIHQFQILRDEQRQIVSKLGDMELEESELKVVISTLEKVDGGRKCYRLIGGILCEKTVKDVLPVLQNKRDDLSKLQVKMKDELLKKGTEINDFKEKHNIRIQGHDEPAQPAGDTDASTKASTAGVLSKP